VEEDVCERLKRVKASPDLTSMGVGAAANAYERDVSKREVPVGASTPVRSGWEKDCGDPED